MPGSTNLRRRRGQKMNSLSQKWKHPGGKLRELGPESLSDSELLAILANIWFLERRPKQTE